MVLCPLPCTGSIITPSLHAFSGVRWGTLTLASQSLAAFLLGYALPWVNETFGTRKVFYVTQLVRPGWCLRFVVSAPHSCLLVVCFNSGSWLSPRVFVFPFSKTNGVLWHSQLPQVRAAFVRLLGFAEQRVLCRVPGPLPAVQGDNAYILVEEAVDPEDRATYVSVLNLSMVVCQIITSLGGAVFLATVGDLTLTIAGFAGIGAFLTLGVLIYELTFVRPWLREPEGRFH